MSKDAQPLEPVHLPQPVVLLQRLRLTWMLAAVVLGAVSAFAAALVRLGFSHLQWVFTGSTAPPPVAGAHLGLWRRALTPVVGGLLATGAVWLRKRHAHSLGREPRPYVEYVEAVRHRGGVVPLVPNGWRTAGAAFSIATGAAVGREGSMIQFAAAIASWCGEKLQRKLATVENGEPLDLRLLVAFGVAGGVTAAYNAPLAAVCFAAEIVLGAFQWRELPPLLLAAGAGRLVTGPMLGWERLYPTPAAWGAQMPLLVLSPLLAVVCGLCGPLYQKLIRSLGKAETIPLAMVWSGCLVGLLSLYDPRVWGNGDLGLSAALGRAELPGLSIAVPALAALLGLRLLATAVCVGTGTVGGVFTPTLFAGAALGALLGHWAALVISGADATLWAIVGMSCFMAAVTHAPWMGAMMAVELTGHWALLPLLLGLNWIAWRTAERLSGVALYAIASQSPGAAAEPLAARRGRV